MTPSRPARLCPPRAGLSRVGLVGLAGLCLALAAPLTGCSERGGDPTREQLAPDDPRQLTERFERLVTAARAGEREAILTLLEPLLVTREELVALFGPRAGQAAWPGYSDQIAGGLRTEAADVIIERVKDGFDTVEVVRVGPAYPDRTTPGDTRLIESLVPRGLAMYSVRLKQPDGKLGLRLNGFIFHDGRWRALLKTYDHLPLPPDAGPPDADAPPDAALPDAGAPDASAPDAAP